MRILFLCGREMSYPRNAVLINALRSFAEIDTIGPLQRPRSLWHSSLQAAWQAAPRLRSSRYDLVFVGFYGHLLMAAMPLVAGLAARRPIVFDAFVSTYDTLAEDRQVFRPGSLAARLAFWLDRRATRLADRVLLDTPLHCEYFRETFQTPTEKLAWLPVGCNEDLFYPRPARRQAGPTSVLYYSSYLPLHGVETVVRAAALLQGEAIHFRLIGDGQTYPAVRRLAEELKPANLEFVLPAPLTNLPAEIASADICLGGHFGASAKAGRVVPGKIYQILAMERPLVAGDTPANRALIGSTQAAVFAAPGSAGELADQILGLHGEPARRERIAAAGRALYERECSEAVIRQRLHKIIAELSPV